jgi:hypothetical protein
VITTLIFIFLEFLVGLERIGKTQKRKNTTDLETPENLKSPKIHNNLTLNFLMS